jgi:hypothetical protein
VQVSLPGQRAGLYGGVFILSAGAAALSVILTRFYSATLGHHFAFFAIALSLFGVGVGGLLLTVVPHIARPPRLFAGLSVLAGVGVFAAVGAGIFLARLKPFDDIGLKQVGWLVLLFVVASLPFVCVGTALAATLKYGGERVSRIYFADLAGAALGSAAAIPLLGLTAPRAVLVTAICFGLASFVFWIASRDAEGVVSKGEWTLHVGVPLAFFFSAVSMTAGDIGAQWFKIDSFKYINPGQVDLTVWNELALVTVDKPARGMRKMRMDASAETDILDAKTNAPHHPDEMAYVLSGSEGPTLVIGAGGGRDVKVAVNAGQTEIDAVEINRAIVDDVMLGQFKEFSGGLFANPAVHVAIADGRSFVRASPKRWRNITLSLVDTWAAASVGGLALSENSLYTVEAFRDFLEHLSDDGVLVVNRWDKEFSRLLALGAAGLRAIGVDDPRTHLFACSATNTTALLLKRTELTADEIKKLAQHCQKYGFKLVLQPGHATTPERETILASSGGARSVTSEEDLSAPTDDRPFFFYSVPPSKLLSTLGDTRKLASEQRGLLTLVIVLGVTLAFALIALVLPLALRRAIPRGGQRWGRARSLAFFGAIGLGFILTELSLVQHLTMFLGHPIYALAAVLTSLLLATGVGSLGVQNVEPARGARVAGVYAHLLAVLLAGLALGLGPLTGALVGLAFPLRLAASMIVVAIAGVLLGALAPLGVRAVAATSPDLVPWCWSVNGFASVLGVALGSLLAMNLGFASLLLIASISYLLGSLALPRAAATTVGAAVGDGAGAPP